MVQGRKRIAHHIGALRESPRGLEAEGAALDERVEARIQELTRTRTEAVRESIEKSILDLRQRKKGVEEKQPFVLDAIRQAESILKSQEDQFTRYGRWIRKVLDQTGEGLKLDILGLISRLLRMDSEMKLALSGVHLKEPVCVVFTFAPPAGLAFRSPPSWRLAPGRLARWRAASCRAYGAVRAALARFESCLRHERRGAPPLAGPPVFAPPNQPNANASGAIPALIEGVIPLPPVIVLRNKGVFETLYRKEHLSAREIERLLGVSHAGVLEALDRFAIPRNGNGRKRTGQLPFGFDYLNYQLVRNSAEQAAIRTMRRYRAGGLSLREIAGNLNEMFVPTKHNGVWQANTVRQILARA